MNDYDRHLLSKAVMRWRQYKNRNFLQHYDMYEFAKFIGYPHVVGDGKIVPTDNPDVQRIIDQINGPYGNAILKILEVRYEKEASDAQDTNA